METYIAYLRVSTKEQGRSGLGLEAQRRDISIFAQQRDSEALILAEYTDIDSGSDSSREALRKAVIHSKKVGATLLVSKLDRLSRKVSFIASLIEDKNLKFKVASMPHADKFQLHIYAALAEQERDFISLRTKAALAEKKAKGAVLGGLRDATNARNKAKKQLADQNANRLWNIIESMHCHGLPLRQIAMRLNAMEIETSTGKQFKAQTIKNVIERVSHHSSD